MTKSFCDRCGREVPINQVAVWAFSELGTHDDRLWGAELCECCRDSLVQVLADFMAGRS